MSDSMAAAHAEGWISDDVQSGMALLGRRGDEQA
jgi:hypothetical protein